jgi:hypothetical protein
MHKPNLYSHMAILVFTLGALWLLSACSVPGGGRVIGGQLVQISELPTYPGGTPMNPAASQIIGPLFNAAQQEAPPFIGLGIEVGKAYQIFQVPSETTFEDVKAFYADKLQSAGWRQDGGMRVLLTQLNATNPNLHGGIWVRVDQTLLIVLMTDAQTGNKELMLSLATH